MTENGIDSFSWSTVRQEVAAGLLIVACSAVIGGIGYIAYTVPAKLDRVISNQMEFKGRLIKVEEGLDEHENRITRLELFQ